MDACVLKQRTTKKHPLHLACVQIHLIFGTLNHDTVTKAVCWWGLFDHNTGNTSKMIAPSLTALRSVVWLLLLGVGFLVPSEAKGKPRSRVKSFQMKVLPKQRFRIPKDDLACFRYVRQHVRRKSLWLRRYPTSVEEAIKWIQKARSQGRFLTQRGTIVGQIQQVIDRPRRSRLHLLFGNNHNVINHYTFFNELLHNGKDGIRLSGVTHLALEAFVTEHKRRRLSWRMRRVLRTLWTGKANRGRLFSKVSTRQKMAELVESDQQHLIDLYIKKNARWSYHVLKVLSHFLLGSAYSPPLLDEMLATLRHARSYPNKIKVLATDMSLRLRKKTQHMACWIYSLREVFGLYAVNRSALRRKSVIMYMWGSNHIRKDHFPRFIPRSEKTFSVRMQGGGKPDVWDHAMAQLHLPMKMFAIITPGVREADMMIHFPAKGAFRMLAGRTGILALSRIRRMPGQPGLRRRSMGLRRRLRMFDAVNYRKALSKTLRRLQFSLLRCYKPVGRLKRRSSIDINITVNPYGRIIKIEFPRRRLGWSQVCLKRRLWRIPVPRPPRRQSIDVLFRVQHTNPK